MNIKSFICIVNILIYTCWRELLPSNRCSKQHKTDEHWKDRCWEEFLKKVINPRLAEETG